MSNEQRAEPEDAEVQEWMNAPMGQRAEPVASADKGTTLHQFARIVQEDLLHCASTKYVPVVTAEHAAIAIGDLLAMLESQPVAPVAVSVDVTPLAEMMAVVESLRGNAYRQGWYDHANTPSLATEARTLTVTAYAALRNAIRAHFTRHAPVAGSEAAAQMLADKYELLKLALVESTLFANDEPSTSNSAACEMAEKALDAFVYGLFNVGRAGAVDTTDRSAEAFAHGELSGTHVADAKWVDAIHKMVESVLGGTPTSIPAPSGRDWIRKAAVAIDACLDTFEHVDEVCAEIIANHFDAAMQPVDADTDCT